MEAFNKIQRMRDREKAEARERWKDESREKLKDETSKKIRTTMIGSIAIIEDVIGWLWGQGKPRTELNSKELEWDGVRVEIRTRILNLGNDQMRAVENTIDNYDVDWKRYNYNFNVENL